jgi:hypothetical protein
MQTKPNLPTNNSLTLWNRASFNADIRPVHKKVNNVVFWDIMPCSPLTVNRRFGGIYRLHLQSSPTRKQAACRVTCLAYFSALKREAICSSCKVEFQRTTRSYTPEYSVTIKFPNWVHKKPHKNKKYLLIPSLNMVPACLCSMFTLLIQRIDCPRKHFFPYRLQFCRHSLLDRWNSLESRRFHRNF